ncbi:hypothetical protein [Streptomyces altiplanensis]
MPQIDTRLVQTAVIGGRDSDQPVILPEEPHNLDEFRRQFGTDRFWCGTLLGGCGEKLMTKRYESKVCHFSHYPAHDGSRGTCHRTANGVDSADHLFIKAHVREWLAQQGHAAQAELRSLGGGPGDAVDFWLRATEQHLRFELNPEDYRSWRRAADSLGAKEGHVEWVFGPDGPIPRDMVARQGYALRVQCESAGTDRRILIGTVTEAQPVAWAPLDACRMTRDGIITPHLDELRATEAVRQGGMRNTPLPGSLPLRAAELVFAVDPGSEPPAHSPLAAHGRYLVPGFIKPAGSRIVRACISLPDDIPAPTEQFVYQLSGAARLLITDPLGINASSWAVRADTLVRLSGLEAERTGLWRPSVSLTDHVTAPPRTPRAQSDTPPPPPAAVERRSTMAAGLRRELEQVAAERTTITWDGLARRTSLYLSHLPEPKRRDLLVEVDKPLRQDTPLLCVLVVAPSGRNLAYLATVLRMLGAQAPGSDAALRRWSQNERKRAYERHSPRLTPATTEPSPPQPSAATPATSQETSTTGWDVPPAGELRSASLMVKKLRLRLQDAVDMRRRATETFTSDLIKAIEQAEKHLADYETARRQNPALRAWLRAGDPIVAGLEQLITQTFNETQSAPADIEPKPTNRRAAQKEAPAAGPVTAPAAPKTENPTDTQKAVAHDEARAELQAIVDLIRSAQKDGNVSAVEAGRRMAGPLYARKLSPDDKERYTPFMREVKAWCLERKPKIQVAPSLRRIRELLAELGRNRENQSVDDIRRALREVAQLRRQLAEPLPASEEGAVKRWRGRLTYRERTERDQSTRTAAPQAHTTPRGKTTPADTGQADRLPLETIDKLATAAHQVLADQARAGGRPLTWGELRHRMGGALPHLHPDDQGELLVAVDRETPADEPLLSTLIASADTSLHWLYPHVRFSLGRERVPDAELETHWAAEVLHLRQLWRHR